MKKNHLLRLIISISLVTPFLSARAQFPIDSETGKVKYTAVIELPGQSKEEIYKKAKLWIVSTLKSGDNMVELTGTNTDQVVGTGNLRIDSLQLAKKRYADHASLNFKFIVFCKEGKLKYSLENIIFNYDYSTIYYDKPRVDVDCEPQDLVIPQYANPNKKEIELFKTSTPILIQRNINALLENFTKAMKKTADDNW